MLKRSILLFFLLVPAVALAADPPIELSMVVTGTITVDPDGGVQSYAINDLDKLPPAARQIVQATVPGWKFAPIMHDGKLVAAKAGMSIRIVAHMIDAKHAKLHIAGASFGCVAEEASELSSGACPPDMAVVRVRTVRPQYPEGAWAGGEVFLVLQIGRDGRVTRAAARQVDLYPPLHHPGHDPQSTRRLLEQASLEAAREWRFRIPTVGPDAAKDHWIVYVPVNFAIIGSYEATRGQEYGHWNAYFPGPVQSIPWDDDDTSSGSSRGSADALAGSAAFIRDMRFVLKTRLDGGTDHS